MLATILKDGKLDTLVAYKSDTTSLLPTTTISSTLDSSNSTTPSIQQSSINQLLHLLLVIVALPNGKDAFLQYIYCFFIVNIFTLNLSR